MAIDIQTENLIRLSDVPKLKTLPRRAGDPRLSIATVYRWCQRGVKGVQLEWLKVGGTRCTTVEALQRFFDAATQRENGGLPVQRVRSGKQWIDTLPAYRRRQIEAAERELEKAGIV
jgi:hypothetical protein